MEDNKRLGMNEKEIDLQRLAAALLRKSWLIVAVSVAAALLTLAVTFFAISPKYEASAKFYVNNSSISVGNTTVSLSSGDLTTSRNLVDSYIVILKTRESINDVIDYAGVNRTYAQVEQMLTAAAVNETEIFEVTVTSTDPEEAEQIANAVAYILPKRISSIIEGTSAKVVEAAVVPAKPSSPSYTMNTLVGFLLGFILSVAFIALREMFNTAIRTEEDIAQSCSHPILASVPDMAASGKGSSHYYGYGSGKAKGSGKHAATQPALLGGQISFAAAEAYKLLRTKIQFSFPDGNASHVIGVSSALSGEGKSLSSINLAYTISELGKKVLLVDCDMRRPTMAEKLGIEKKPGLSSYLTGQCELFDLIKPCGMEGEETAFDVIVAGQNPPNPIELLSSARMDTALNALRGRYDYIILDLPPIGEVSDAMAVAGKTDGILLVVRQELCNRLVLQDTVQQFEFVNAKILGVVFNCTAESSGKYGKSYYRKYRTKYESRYYGRGYETSARRVKQPADKQEK